MIKTIFEVEYQIWLIFDPSRSSKQKKCSEVWFFSPILDYLVRIIVLLNWGHVSTNVADKIALLT